MANQPDPTIATTQNTIKPVKIGLIGVGNISKQYINGCRVYPILEIAACADIDMERTRAVAAEYGIPKACTVEELLADPVIEIVINLTIPKVHAQVSLQILAAGKHAYSEKPLAINTADGKQILESAQAKGLRLGCAPDTFLGGGQQTSRWVIDNGLIGRPIAANAFFASRGPEPWHPNPDFFYQMGGGPMLDMGPYYVTALVNLFGPVKRVSGAANAAFTERIAGHPSQQGKRIPVEVPTHYAGILEFSSGAVATLVASFDIWSNHQHPPISVFGTEGNLSVPDPNTFGGTVKVSQHNEAWRDVPLTHSDKIGRGTGVADLAYAIQSSRPARATGELAYHVLEVMTAVEKASQSGHYVAIESQPAQPKPLPVGLPEGELDR